MPERNRLGLVSKDAWTDLERDLEAQNQRVDDLEAVRAGQLDRRQLELAQLKLAQLDKKIDEMTAKLAELTTNVERASGLLSGQRDEFNARHGAIEKLDTAIAQKTAHLAKLNAQIQAAQETLKPAEPPEDSVAKKRQQMRERGG